MKRKRNPITTRNFRESRSEITVRVDFHCRVILVRMHVKFTCANEIEGMYERPPVKVKAEPRSTFPLTRDCPSIASILFTRVKITRQWKSAFREFTAMFTPYRITQLRRHENHTG